MSKKDYYEVLEVARSADSSEIKKAYLKLAKKHHPDCNSGDPESEKKFKEAGEAYDVLKDEQKKSAYDRFGHGAFEQGGGGAWEGRSLPAIRVVWGSPSCGRGGCPALS